MKKLYVFLLCLMLLGAYSCKKDSNSTNGSSSSTTFLTTGSWKLSKYEYQQKDQSWVADPDPKGVIPITITFNAGGTFSEIYDKNNSVAAGLWTLSSDNSQITIGGGAVVAGTYTINTLSQSSFVITEYNFVGYPPYISMRATYIH